MRMVNITNVVVGVAAGGLNKVMAMQDENAGRVGFGRSWESWTQIGLTGLGLLGQLFNFFPRYADPVTVAGTTLLTGSVIDAIRSRAPASAAVTRARQVASAGGSGRVGWIPKAVGK